MNIHKETKEIIEQYLDTDFRLAEVGNYYQPTIEEFHIGFEFEKLTEKGWELINSCDKRELVSVVSAFSYIQSYRVRYLEREDLEKLGFVYEDKNEVYIYNKTFRGLGTGDDRKCVLFYYEGEKEVLIQLQENRGTIYVLFSGVIKNVSELKSLLKQLQII